VPLGRPAPIIVQPISAERRGELTPAPSSVGKLRREPQRFWKPARSCSSLSPIVAVMPRSRSARRFGNPQTMARSTPRSIAKQGSARKFSRRGNIQTKPLDLALVVTFARAAKPIREQVVRLQLANTRVR